MMTIGTFSERTGLRPKTLRYYEEVGLLEPSVRAANGYRQYEESQVETAALIHSLRQADVGIADIRRFIAGDRAERDLLLRRWREEAEAKLLSLQIARQFLHGFHPGAKHLRLVRWEEPKAIAWCPRTPATAAADRTRGYYLRWSEEEDGLAFSGEIGYEVDAELAADAGASLHPPALFAAIACNPGRSAPCQPIFSAIRGSGFEPVGTPLRHYAAGSDGRYTLLVPVMYAPIREEEA